MSELQGDTVLVVVDKDQFIFTIVRFVDEGHEELQLINRSSKDREPMPLTQAAFDAMVLVKEKDQPKDKSRHTKWKLVL